MKQTLVQVSFLEWLKSNGFKKQYYKLLKVKKDIRAIKKLIKTDARLAFLHSLWYNWLDGE